MLDLGDVQQLSFTTTDAAGNLADAGSVALTITLPDGTTVAPAPVPENPETGRYTYAYQTTQAGRHLVRWVATGANAGAYTDVFDVAAATPGFILSLADARKAIGLPESDTSKDEELREYDAAVAEVVEDVAGPVLYRTGLTWTVDGGTQNVMLPTAAAEVTSVVEDGTTLTAGSDYTVDLENGVITRGPAAGPFARGRGNVVVTYTVGAAAVPERVRTAAKIVLRHLWQADQQGYRPDFGSPDTEVITTPSGFLMPRRAYQLLAVDPDVPGFA